jgi:alginate O-acetyltransferase complex protein AlgI
VLPLGISFYTFEAISYIVDVYRGTIPPFRSPAAMICCTSLFPSLTRGAIRPFRRLRSISCIAASGSPGCVLRPASDLFLIGAFKKAVLADWMAGVVDPVFKSPGDYGSAALWTATLGYAIQIYGDFSGYSDMAIGIARHAGVQTPC